MDIICTKKCYDVNNDTFVIGGKYKYYDSDFVFDVLDTRIYNIYKEEDGEDIYMGNGSYQYICTNFFIKEELTVTKLICKNNSIGSNGRKYVEGVIYNFTIKEQYYKVGEEKSYCLYDEDMHWLGYTKMRFLSNNFIEWNEYLEEFLKVDELFSEMLLQ